MKNIFSHPVVVSLLTLLGIAFILLLIQYFQCTGKAGVCKFFSLQGLSDLLILNRNESIVNNRPCGDQFFVKLQDIAPDEIRVLNVWKADDKWVTTEATLVLDGMKDEDVSLRKEITEEQKNEYCAQIYHPPYPWYTEANTGGRTQEKTQNKSIT